MIRDWWVTAVAALAVYRVAVLVTADVILDRPRTRLVARGGRVGEFVVCPFCVSVWLGALVAAVDYEFGTPLWLLYVYLALALSGVAGWLASR